MSEETYGNGELSHEGHAAVDKTKNDGDKNTVVITDTSATVVVEQPASKGQVVVEKTRNFLNAYAYEVFAVSVVVGITAFTLLFPKLALGVAAVVAATSGWVAYYGLRKRHQPR